MYIWRDDLYYMKIVCIFAQLKKPQLVMTKKISFDTMPSALEKILNILNSEGSEHTVLPELAERVALLEKKIDYLQKTVSPERPTMDMQEVCRVLKLRPKAVNQLAMAGLLPSTDKGRKIRFYEEGVVRYFMTLPAWKEAAAAPKHAAPATDDADNDGPAEEVTAAPTTRKYVRQKAVLAPVDGRQRVDVNGASRILDRSKAAVRQKLSSGLPHHKDGRNVYFFVDELVEWAKNNRPRPRRKNR